MAYLIVDSWSTTCSECGGNASPRDRSHIQGGLKSGYETGSRLDDQNGCRAKFTHHVSLYGDSTEDLRRMFWGE